MTSSRFWIATIAFIACLVGLTINHGLLAADFQQALRQLDSRVLSDEERETYQGMVASDIERRRLLAIRRENEAWRKVQTRDDWEQFRDQRLQALRQSLGHDSTPATSLKVVKTGQLDGDGYRIENLIYESRPGLYVTANLYLPAEPTQSMPAVLLSHSHHNPKTQGELQDMGMTWARQGWVVLVIDHLGHGERRQHPFVSADSYPRPFAVGRQDYYFRYNTGLQLHLIGESLIGWMVRDLMRGVDLLCSRDAVDQDRIILIGSVAGGGDPAGVTAALDPRIAAVIPFNFGGPQPDYAIPSDAENAFYYFGVAYWESTRCLRLGGRDGFAHWLIVGSVAPRRLVYSSEFGWDRDRDPIWPRLEKVFRLYNAGDHLDVAFGRGTLKGRPPESTHCNNVGVFHRRNFYPHLQRWFQMDPPPAEYQHRRDTKELTCWTAAAHQQLKPEPLYQLASQIGRQRALATRRELAPLDRAGRRGKLRRDWSLLLGKVEPRREPTILHATRETAADLHIERVLLEVEKDVVVPMVTLRAGQSQGEHALPGRPTIVMISTAGKQRLIDQRSPQIATLIAGGAVVCLPDLRGIGETRSGENVGPRSTATTLSCRDQVLGQTLMGSRLRDLRGVLWYLRRRDQNARISLWGDSLADPNPADRIEVVPYRVDNPNRQAEPSGALLALLGALFEDDVCTVYASGGFATYRSLLDSQFLYVPHASVIPGALTAGDIADLAAAVAPRPLRLENFINGRNRRVSAESVDLSLAHTVHAYDEANAKEQLFLSADAESDAAAWVLSSGRAN